MKKIIISFLIASVMGIALTMPLISRAKDIGGMEWRCTGIKLSTDSPLLSTTYTSKTACEAPCIEAGGMCSIVVTPTYVINLVNTYLKWFMTAVVLIGVFVIIWGGFNYMFAKGDDTKLKNARKMILYALLGIAITLFASGIVWTVGNFLSTTP